ncbi:MAG: hypothetical protein N3B21_15220 [Clostridia bacterium]|nr:hypothetical protein [Clostridia bacterium]
MKRILPKSFMLLGVVVAIILSCNVSVFAATGCDRVQDTHTWERITKYNSSGTFLTTYTTNSYTYKDLYYTIGKGYARTGTVKLSESNWTTWESEPTTGKPITVQHRQIIYQYEYTVY